MLRVPHRLAVPSSSLHRNVQDINVVFHCCIVIHAMNKSQSSNVARLRWKILAEALRQHDKTAPTENLVSVRRFLWYGLLKREKIIKDDNDDCDWYLYHCSQLSSVSLKIRCLRSSLSIDKLAGFNNTGNVCIWPSEEVLAFYSLKHPYYFKGKRIIELGGGMTCLAGLMASTLGASEVLLTDGNKESVVNVKKILAANHHLPPSIEACAFRWDESSDVLLGKFDVILCSDCLFSEEGKCDLINAMFRLLSPNGVALLTSPRRGLILSNFCHLARDLFTLVTMEMYDVDIWSHHKEALKNPVYNSDLHYPHLITMRKKNMVSLV